MTGQNRNNWLALPDATLLKQCEVDTYRASGPGGQKRNKTSSAVRLRHSASGLLVIAEESRSQHENKANALRRLRQTIALEIRSPIEKTALADGDFADRGLIREVIDKKDRLFVGKKDRRFWPVAAVILDIMFAQEARVAETARALGISTGNLIRFLQISPKLWERVNRLRHDFGRKPLQKKS